MSFTLPRKAPSGTRALRESGNVYRHTREARAAWRGITAGLWVIILGGCASTPPDVPSPTPAPVPIATSDSAYARSLFRDIRHDDATVRRASAQTILDEDLLGELSQAQRFDVLAVLIEAAISIGRIDAATEALIDAIAPVSDGQRGRFHELWADYHAIRDDHFEAFVHLVHATELPDAERNRRIWAHLEAIPRRLVSAPSGEHPLFDREARGWWDLARRYARATAPEEQARVWASWRELNAGHQATTSPIDIDATVPRRIALLLPLSGAMVSAGEAIRDGFIAAQLEGSRGADEIVLFDTGDDIEAAIDEALRAEVDVMVGPLLKENVAHVAARALEIPIVALNQIDATFDNVIQLALASEDDARVIAEAVRAQGFERVVMVAIPQAWSQRAFIDLSEALGSTIVETTTIDEPRNVTELTAALFDVDEGQERHSVITRLVGEDVEFSAVRRQDVDAVIALVGSVQLAGLLPALSFHAANDLPLLLPSNVLRSTPNSSAVTSMQVAVPTWQLAPNLLERESIRRVASATQSPLVALGIDAYRIVKRLDRFRAQEPIIGSTGVLRFEDDVVVRDLHWAEYERGRLRHRPLTENSSEKAASTSGS